MTPKARCFSGPSDGQARRTGMATLDLHANVTVKMAESANALITYRTYPHIDMAERGRQMAELLARQFAGEVDGYETLIGRLDQWTASIMAVRRRKVR